MMLRKANMRDIPGMLSLINTYATQGIMLPRTEFEIAEGIRDFIVAEEASELIGCGALHIYTPAAAEVRSLAVDSVRKGKGAGRALVEALEAEAVSFGVTSLFAFTYVPGFFHKLGYTQVDRGLLPQKAWKDCLRCPKFQNCDEIAVHKPIAANSATFVSGTRMFNVLPSSAAAPR